MNSYLRQMLPANPPADAQGWLNQMREVMQQLALLALWRAHFFDTGAFYGGTALRILYGLDRFSEDLDFSLLAPDDSLSFGVYKEAIEREFKAFGFSVQMETRQKTIETAVESAFLKANTLEQLMIIDLPEEYRREFHSQAFLKIRIEADTQPPPGFDTEMKYLFSPVPFAVRVFTLPCLFAGKMHALLCRGWKTRVKGRDWYDFVWYAAHHPQLHLAHLEARMRQTGHFTDESRLTPERLTEMFLSRLHSIDIEKARDEVQPFLNDPRSVELWSIPFFEQAFGRIQFV